MNGAAVFLDRDGVLNRIVPRDGRPGSPRRLDELIVVDEAPRAVARLREAGYRTFIVTNQPDIARGLLAASELEAMMDVLRGRVEVDDARICRHDDVDACACRKPKPGMILDLAARWAVDLARSYVIGDSWKDMEASRAAGCRGILLERPYNVGAWSAARASSLGEAVDLILKG